MGVEDIKFDIITRPLQTIYPTEEEAKKAARRMRGHTFVIPMILHARPPEKAKRKAKKRS